MSYKESYLFFNEVASDDADAAGDGAMYKASSFLGARVSGAAATTLCFEAGVGSAADDVVVVTQGTSNIKLLMQELVAVLSSNKSGLFIQSDNPDELGANGNFLSDSTIVITKA
tara:strand:+ start:529 stop:870 length:342 start_codon:yes stop_codon:yes gene_type:complete